MTSPPPAKKLKEPDSNTVSMVVEKWKKHQTEQWSTIHQICGYPWRLRLFKEHNGLHFLELHCDKSSESELWECTAQVWTPALFRNTFKSWDKESQRDQYKMKIIKPGRNVEVKIYTKDDGLKWRNRPILSSFEPRDGILLIGREQKKIYVNKQSLSSQSSFFDRLFNGDFKEKNMKEIPIRDVEYEEFLNVLKIIYEVDHASLTDDNVHKILVLADKFDLKIVEDKVVNYLLSASSLSINAKLLISDQYNIKFLKDKIISQYTRCQLNALSYSPMYDRLSKETTRALLRKCCVSDSSDSDNKSSSSFSSSSDSEDSP